MIGIDMIEIRDMIEEMIEIKSVKAKININQKVSLTVNKEKLLKIDIKKKLKEIDLDLVLNLKKRIEDREEILHIQNQMKNKKVHQKKRDPKEMINLTQDLDQEIEIVRIEEQDIDLEVISIQIIQSINPETVLLLKNLIKKNAEVIGSDQKVIQHLKIQVQVIAILLDQNLVY